VDVRIDTARLSDADAVLKPCYLAYRSEAQLYDDWSIPPLREAYADVVRAVDEGVVLVARCGDEIVGSVRGLTRGRQIEVGRLVVYPRLRQHGIGSRLLHAIEAAFPDAERFALFTGERSPATLRLYAKHGYCELRRELVSPKLTMVVLEKQLTAKAPDRAPAPPS
jgi:GNAT superfamily N-acetyltransferase